MKTTARFAWLILSDSEQTAFLQSVRSGVSAEEFERISAMTKAFPELLRLFEERGTSLQRVLQIAFGASTEKTAKVCKTKEPPATSAHSGKTRRKGHGRRAAKAYTGARRIHVPHPSLQAGQICPDCGKGKLRLQPKAAPALHLAGQPPITATVHELEVLRCSLCGKTFTAPLPAEAGLEKHDPSVGVMVGLLRYGTGMPFYRLEQWQQNLGVPLPASTQWELVDEVARQIEPVVDELAVVAAQAPRVYNDDTTMRVGQLRRQIQKEQEPKRTGIACDTRC